MTMGAFRTIRIHHAADHLAVLTTRPFVKLLAASGYFDDVLIDDRLKPWQFPGWWRLIRLLRRRRFDRVYDLQRNQRTRVMYTILASGRGVEWSGVFPGCSHYVQDDRSVRRHIVDKLAEQLSAAGIAEMLAPDISWLTGDVARFDLPRRYALIVPGSAPHRPEKRARADCFVGIGFHLLDADIVPIVLGTGREREQIDRIRAGCPNAIDLSDRTSFGDIAELARGAVGAIGNDTGAMHLIATAGCASLVLFSAASDPLQIAPRGRRVRIVQRETLSTLSADQVIEAWEAMLSEQEGFPPRTATEPDEPPGRVIDVRRIRKD
ncbi:MAG: glycosyltransferase family 9 protein [Stellaceae bacterium]